MSLYDPLVPEPTAHDAQDLERVRAEFERAGRPFLGSAATWLAWAVLLPTAALITRQMPAGAFVPVLLIWSGAILAGGATEAIAIYRRSQRHAPTPLGSWVLRSQGNLSLVALALSALLIWLEATWAIPGAWLLVLGHSLYGLGGLAFTPFKLAGITYQLGGLAALWPYAPALEIFAATTAAANLWLAWSIYRRHRGLSEGRQQSRSAGPLRSRENPLRSRRGRPPR